MATNKKARNETDWSAVLAPLMRKYKGRKHPLNYESIYQLLVLVVLSARDSDDRINLISPALFKAFPDMKSLSIATPEMVYPYVKTVRSYIKKTNWLIAIAQEVKEDKNIPLTMEGLVNLHGIGRKSANVILREAKVKAEGVMVDLHVIRVAQRLGIATTSDAKKIELQMMEKLPQKDWSEAGMAISFLGREICRPSNPHHKDCVMKESCQFYQEQLKQKKG
ncbi:MAG TPA: endonuclease III [Chitinophagaceae bacterium]|jgi:endonuclease-3|nr:endonuclease III [Chitinophagaceae bacterium]